MENKKPFYKSQTIIALVVSLISKTLGMYFGFDALEGQEQKIAQGVVTALDSTDSISALISFGASFAADYFVVRGRLKANSQIGK